MESSSLHDATTASAFGIAMATLAARRKHDIMIYARDLNVVQVINETHRSPRVVLHFTLLPNIRATTSVREAVADAKMVIVWTISHDKAAPG
ncbi:unnamed protein product [Peronospora farinosa]|uniref:Glycerol-3-phosphate dehydrogenase NAD-dependent N-terminal domain-containing protein n=1 Tax=Peronospora farinosa TaxID=134698 RepID=A0AAV0T1K2_9STRA|nr:unnamed protein product [Peronospora farinosa]